MNVNNSITRYLVDNFLLRISQIHEPNSIQWDLTNIFFFFHQEHFIQMRIKYVVLLLINKQYIFVLVFTKIKLSYASRTSQARMFPTLEGIAIYILACRSALMHNVDNIDFVCQVIIFYFLFYFQIKILTKQKHKILKNIFREKFKINCCSLHKLIANKINHKN